MNNLRTFNPRRDWHVLRSGNLRPRLIEFSNKFCIIVAWKIHWRSTDLSPRFMHYASVRGVVLGYMEIVTRTCIEFVEPKSAQWFSGIHNNKWGFTYSFGITSEYCTCNRPASSGNIIVRAEITFNSLVRAWWENMTRDMYDIDVNHSIQWNTHKISTATIAKCNGKPTKRSANNVRLLFGFQCKYEWMDMFCSQLKFRKERKNYERVTAI